MRFIPHSLFLILFLISINTSAQNLMAFVDYQGKFQVFEDGVFRQIEYMPLQSFKIGYNCVGYVDNTTEFKIYYQGVSNDVAYASNLSYRATRGFLIYQINQILSVFDNGKTTQLSYYIARYTAGDSIIGFYDDNVHTLQEYYQGKIKEIETNLLNPPDTMMASSNALLFLDPNDYLKIFYKGVVTDLGTNLASRYLVGSDIAAYVDSNTQFFKVFYKGDIAKVESFPPKSFKCGDGIVAYVDNTGSFKILSNGVLTTIKSFEPDSFIVRNNLVLYSYNGIYSVFYNDAPIEIERNALTNYQISETSLAYLDDLGHLRLFHNGKVEDISIERPTKFLLRGNVLWYKLGNNDDKILYKGRVY